MDSSPYYTDLTEHYIRYGGQDGFHYGVWEPDVCTLSQSLVRSHELIAGGIDITPDTRVLDAGCGLGPFAIWCARRFGCRVTGVSNCPAHLAIARQRAAAAGVAGLCEFIERDMNDLDLPPGEWDLVVNQESICHVNDKGAYLGRVLELLAPGGTWSASAFALRAGKFNPRERRSLETVQRGFFIPNLLTGEQVLALLGERGFGEIDCRDLTRLVQPTARHILRHALAPQILIRLQLDWLFFRGGAASRRHHQGHFQAGWEYSRGLLGGWFRYLLYRARKPALGNPQKP